MSPPPSNRPFVSVNFALTWDGRISTRNRTPSDFSSPRDKHRLLEIRSTGDAVLAGAGTIAADRMTMGLPDEELRKARVARGQAEYPLRVLLTNSGKLDPTLRVFGETFSPILIFSTERMPAEVQEALRGKAELHLAPEPAVNLGQMLSTLYSRYGVRRLVCEGGGQVLRSLAAEDLVDELHLTLCPRIFGGTGAPTLTGVAGEYLPHSTRWKLEAMEVVEQECFLRYSVLRPTE